MSQPLLQVLPISARYWRSEAQLERIKPYFPQSHGRPRVDGCRVISGMIHIIGNGPRWRDAPEAYGPHKTLYNRFVRRSRMGVFCRIFESLAREDPKPQRLIIDQHLKAHRTAASLAEEGARRAATGAQSHRRSVGPPQLSCQIGASLRG